MTRNSPRRRRYASGSGLRLVVRRYGFTVAALAMLAAIQLVGSGVIVIDDNSPAPLAMLADVQFVVPQY